MGRRNPWVVLKFGGTSVSSVACWETIAKVLRDRISEGLRPVVVCSALSQVSNQLEEALEQALAGEAPQAFVEDLRARHRRFASELGIEIDREIDAEVEHLTERLTGVSLLQEASPRVRADVLAVGEMLSTRLGAAWLRAQGLPTRWLDARTLLQAEERPDDAHRQYLSATCGEGTDEALSNRLASVAETVLLTQGFVVGGPRNDTAVLGRGGSDTSASYLGERLGARHVEIWTDVPGLFSADPRIVAQARRLDHIAFDEAMELTTRGAKVLHPRSLAPAQRAGLPIHVRCTPEPSSEGTIIEEGGESAHGEVVAISSRQGMAVVTMDVESSWQEVGVIAELVSHFSRYDLSIDAISSSQTRVTVSLDPSANALHDDTIRDLMSDLARCSEPQLIRPVASVSIVGTRLQYTLPALPSLLHVLDRQTVHLLAHAANDRSLTFVVEESAADDIVRHLHDDIVRS